MEGRVDAWAEAKGSDVVTYSGALEKAHVRCKHCLANTRALPARLLRLGECFSLPCLVRKSGWEVKKDMEIGDTMYSYGIYADGHCVVADVGVEFGSVSAPYTYDYRFLYAYDYGFLYVHVKRLDDLIPAVQKVLLEAQADEDEPEDE
jgi:hypothetical protein